jgi:hypothetical protein
MDLLNLVVLVWLAFLIACGFWCFLTAIKELRSADRMWRNVLGLLLLGVYITYTFGSGFLRIWNIL